MKLQEALRRIEEVFKEDKVTIYIGSSAHIEIREWYSRFHKQAI
jgi:hypothetical protein